MFLIRSIVTCSQRFFLNVFFYTLCTFLVVNMDQEMLIVSSGNDIFSTSFTSNLCENASKSCAHQIGSANVSEELCYMTFHNKNATECQSRQLTGNDDPDELIGKMMLKAYVHVYDKYGQYSAFNVSFKDMRWNKIYMRFIMHHNRTPSLCREFNVSEKIAKNLTLFFDCLWSLEHLDGNFCHFDYQAITPSGDTYIYKYLFFVPLTDKLSESQNVTKWSPFLIVDISAAPSQLTLRIQKAPPSLQVYQYKIKVQRTLQDNTWVADEKTLESRNNETELRYTYKTKLKFGKYKFVVFPQHKDCRPDTCNTTTPEYLIVEMTEPKLLTGLVATVILIPILLMLYFIWKRNCDTNEPSREPIGPPKFLLMYKPVSVEHINTMIELFKYFKKCHLHPMIDQFGIAESETKDPVRWYSDAFNEADFVGIFASPTAAESDRQRAQKFNKYSHTEVIAQNQLSMSLCSPGAKCKFFCVALPGTKWDTLPPEAQALKRYNLPRDLDPLLVLIGVAPQCDRGAGFQAALEAARSNEPSFVFDKLPEPPFRKPPSPIPDDELGPSTTSGINKDDDTSLCLDTAISGSDLLSSRQYLSDEMSTPPSSLDQLSLLGESN